MSTVPAWVIFSFKLCTYDKAGNLITDGAGAGTPDLYSPNWNAAVQFTPAPVERVSRQSVYGCIGIDLNPKAIGWVYVNLHGKQMRLPFDK